MSLFEFPEQIHIYECKWSVFDLTFPKLLFAVLLGDFHLEYLVFTDGGSHFRQALSARAPNTNQKHVAPGLSDHTYCTGYWGGNTKTSCKFFIYKILVMACGLCFLLLFWYLSQHLLMVVEHYNLACDKIYSLTVCFFSTACVQFVPILT